MKPMTKKWLNIAKTTTHLIVWCCISFWIFSTSGGDDDADEDEAWSEPGRDILAAVQATDHHDDKVEIIGTVDNRERSGYKRFVLVTSVRGTQIRNLNFTIG